MTTMTKIDYKKEFPELYLPKTKGMIINIPAIPYIMIKGHGNPNDENGEYPRAIQLLYGISFVIKMSKKGSRNIEGYHDYAIPPLEGLWWMQGMEGADYASKENFDWYAIMRLPDYATEEVFQWACSEYQKKHPEADTSIATYQIYEEGLCAQIMHKGSYDEEPATVEALHEYLAKEGYVLDFDSVSATGQLRKHHEIYLSDPRKSKPENMKTVIRHPIRKG